MAGSPQSQSDTVIISVMNSKGGVGKSTLVVHLAGWLKLHKMQNVRLCDCDPQRSSSNWMKSAVPQMQTHQIVTSGDLTSILMKAKADEYIIIDGKAGDTDITRGILLDSDLVLIPTSPSKLDLEVTQRQCHLVQQIRKLTNSPRPNAFVILNKLGKDKQSGDIGETREIEGIPVFPFPLKLRSPYSDSAGKGCLVWDLPFFTLPAQREMNGFFSELWKSIEIPATA